MKKRTFTFMILVSICMVIGACQWMEYIDLQIQITAQANQQAACDSSEFIETPNFYQLYPVHGHFVDTGGVWYIGDGNDQGFTLRDAVENYHANNGGTFDSLILMDNADTIGASFKANMTAWVVGSTLPAIREGWYQEGGTNNISRLQVIGLDNHITSADIDSLRPMVEVLPSVHKIVLYSIDSANAGDGLQLLIDNCSQGGEIEYHIPIDSVQIAALLDLNWLMHDNQ